MRNPPVTLVPLIALLSGCAVTTQPPQASSDNWVDEQIARSANSISLAQQRLNSTNPAQPKGPVATPLSAPASAPGEPNRIVSAPGAAQGGSPGSLAKPAALPGAPGTPIPPAVQTAPIANPAPPAATSQPGAPVAKQNPPSPGLVGKTSPPINTSVNNKVFGATPPVPIEALIAPVSKPLPPPIPKEVWTVTPADVNVRRALTRWADKAGWTVKWEVPDDVLISSSATFEGDFKSAVEQLFAALTTAETGLVPLRYKNKVIRVTESGKRAK